MHGWSLAPGSILAPKEKAKPNQSQYFSKKPEEMILLIFAALSIIPFTIDDFLQKHG
jgi:hypothetical protein